MNDDHDDHDDADDSEPDDNNNNGNELLEQLRARVRAYAQEHGMAAAVDDEEVIDAATARTLLQVAGGSVRAAAQLYWDDFLARRHAAGGAAAAQQQDDDDDSDGDDDDDEDEDDDGEDAHNDAGAAAGQPMIAADADDDDEPAPEINGDAAVARALRRRLFDGQRAAAAAAQEDSEDDNHSEDDNNENNNNEQQRIIEESTVSNVSDDEGVWRWTRSGHKRSHVGGGDGGGSDKKKRKLASTTGDRRVDDFDDDDDGYVSERDWIWDAISEPGLDANPLSDPTDLLWGLGPTAERVENGKMAASETAVAGETAAADKEEAKQQQANKDDDDSDSNKCSKKLDAKKQGENKKNAKMKDGDAPADDDLEEEEDEDDEPSSGIPRTWMNAGFHIVLSQNDDEDDSDAPIVDETKKAAMPVVGLALREPHEDDMAYFCHKQLVQNDTSQKVPPPYHCRGITALLSVVTALLYTGASVQDGNHVSCASTTRRPILDVVAEHAERVQKQKKKKTSGSSDNNNAESTSSATPQPPALSARELESRLVDALSALLVIAAQASIERKRRALQPLQHSKDPDEQRKWQKVQRKLHLVPTCWWEADHAGEVRLPESNDDDGRTCSVQVTTSLTHVQDLRAYCLSNLKAFTGSGGCALFLETILRIHGKGAVRRMMRQARARVGNPTLPAAAECLVHCACDHHHHERMTRDKGYAKKLKAAAKKNEALDTTPRRGGDCVSVELLSLLLTGRVHSTLRGWSTGGALGVGLLTHPPGTVGRGLTRPEKPVWILKGPTCYSVLFLSSCSDHADTFARVDHDGQVAALTHWNPWYGGDGPERHGATLFRLAADRSEWKPPPVSSSSSSSSDGNDDDDTAQFEREIAPLSRSLQTLARSRRQHRLRANQQHRVETVDPALLVTPAETDRVQAHPDDPQFYPNQHRMWRYSLQGGGDGDDDDSNKNAAKQQPQWRPFFSLSDREKLVVETKLGPKIAPILWTRWPRATVDRFVPAEPAPIV